MFTTHCLCNFLYKCVRCLVVVVVAKSRLLGDTKNSLHFTLEVPPRLLRTATQGELRERCETMADDERAESVLQKTEAREQDGEEQALIPDGTLYPLNSRRLRTVHLQLLAQTLAQTLGLPTTNISTKELDKPAD